MPMFKYTALNKQGRLVDGLQEAEGEKHATQILSNQSLTLTKLTLVKQQTKFSWFTPYIHHRQLSIYLQQLAMMLKTNIPVESAIEALSTQAGNLKHKTIWSSIKTHINEGKSLSQAMREFPKSFPNLIIANIASGEQSGKLDIVLEKTAENLIKTQHFQTQIQQALAYPIIVSFVAFLIIFALLTFVVPQIIEVFSQLDKALPPLTNALIALSNWLQNYLEYIAISFVLLILGVKWIKSQPNLKYYWDMFWLKTPFSKLIKYNITIQFTHTMTVLLGSGISMVDAIYHTLEGVNNLVLKDRLKTSAKMIKEGGDIFKAFKSSNLFDQTSLQLIYFGQASGQVEQIFEQISQMLEQELDRKTKTFLAIFEPLLILIMGSVVLLIVLAIMLPILGLNEIL